MPLFGMMPMMKLRRANQHPQGTNRRPYIRVDKHRPEPAERQQAGDHLHWKSKYKGRQIDERHRIHRVQRVLAMRGQPVKMLGAVMDRVKAPKESHTVLQPMAPIDE